MPEYTLIWTRTFLRTLRVFLRRHPDLEGVATDLFAQLENDPFAPRLRLHALKGRHRGKHAVSLTYSYRIVLVLKFSEKEIVLLDIGAHDQVYRD